MRRIRHALERLNWWLAFRLPRQLVYFATIRLWGHATTGRWGNTVVPELTVDEALRRWGEG